MDSTVLIEGHLWNRRFPFMSPSFMRTTTNSKNNNLVKDKEGERIYLSMESSKKWPNKKKRKSMVRKRKRRKKLNKSNDFHLHIFS